MSRIEMERERKKQEKEDTFIPRRKRRICLEAVVIMSPAGSDLLIQLHKSDM
jgi:hypothetical protein